MKIIKQPEVTAQMVMKDLGKGLYQFVDSKSKDVYFEMYKWEFVIIGSFFAMYYPADQVRKIIEMSERSK